MGNNPNKLKDKTLSAVNKLKANIKETFFHLADIPSVTVNQLADFIQQHPDTQVTRKELLGIAYTFYRLKINEDHFYMETNHSRILQLDGFSNGKPFVSYRSYRDAYALNTPIKIS